MEMRNKRVTKCVFLLEYEPWKDNWCSEIAEIFKALDIELMSDFFTCNTNVVEQQIRDLEARTWGKKFGDKSKLKLCKEFRNNKNHEIWLGLNMYRTERSILAQWKLK